MHVYFLQWLLHCTVAVALEQQVSVVSGTGTAEIGRDSSSQAHSAAQSAGVLCGTHRAGGQAPVALQHMMLPAII